eukprot:178199_1
MHPNIDRKSSHGDRASIFDFQNLEKTKQPIQLSFRNINFFSTRKENTGKQILQNVSGIAEPGQFLAILGPSGAGKTSLLSLLAGRLAEGAGSVSGDVRVNGRHVDHEILRTHA